MDVVVDNHLQNVEQNIENNNVENAEVHVNDNNNAGENEGNNHVENGAQNNVNDNSNIVCVECGNRENVRFCLQCQANYCVNCIEIAVCEGCGKSMCEDCIEENEEENEIRFPMCCIDNCERRFCHDCFNSKNFIGFCEECEDYICHDCQDETWEHILCCERCGTDICRHCNEGELVCDTCNDLVCKSCREILSNPLLFCDICELEICKDCRKENTIDFCHDCITSVCKKCQISKKHTHEMKKCNVCKDTTCNSCLKKQQRKIHKKPCNSCGSVCTKCAPNGVQCVGTEHGETYCEKCDEGAKWYEPGKAGALAAANEFHKTAQYQMKSLQVCTPGSYQIFVLTNLSREHAPEVPKTLVLHVFPWYSVDHLIYLIAEKCNHYKNDCVDLTVARMVLKTSRAPVKHICTLSENHICEFTHVYATLFPRNPVVHQGSSSNAIGKKKSTEATTKRLKRSKRKVQIVRKTAQF